MYIKTSIILMFALANLSCIAQHNRPGSAEKVSMVRVLSNPTEYHNKKILLTGFLHSKFEDSAIYYSKDHGDYLMTSDAFWVILDSESNPNLKSIDMDEKYVMIVGTFYKDQFGHMGSFAGTIKVESIQLLKKWSKK